jgi:ribose-phosphate pyrophosphokinase
MPDPFASGQRGPLMMLSGSANPALAGEIAETLGIPLGETTIRRFADGEIFVRINENVRGRDTFIIQPTPPPADTIVELLLLIDAARRASAARITAVVPYFGYARQDRKDQPRVAIGAKLMANMIATAGADRVLGVDFHQHQLQGFFDIPVDHLYAAPVITRYFREKQLAQPGRDGAGRGRGEDGARLREAAGRDDRHHRQASADGERLRGAARDR